MLGKNLKLLRKDKGLTQDEFSKVIGIAQTTYAGYENEKHEPDIETLTKIADYYKISVDYLIGRIMR